MIIRLASILLALVVSCVAQEFDLDSVPQFVFSDQVTLTGSTTRWTIQLPANSERSTYVVAVSVYCADGCTLAQFKGGTPATQTEVAGIALNLPQTSTAKFYKNSDSTGGSSITAISIDPNSSQSITTKVVLRKGSNTASNYSLAVTGASGIATIHMITAERAR